MVLPLLQLRLSHLSGTETVAVNDSTTPVQALSEQMPGSIGLDTCNCWSSSAAIGQRENLSPLVRVCGSGVRFHLSCLQTNHIEHTATNWCHQSDTAFAEKPTRPLFAIKLPFLWSSG